MNYVRGGLLLCITSGVLLSGCAAAKAPAEEVAQPITGWYSHNEQGDTFQPCGSSQPWLVAKSADLSARATSFGLQNGTPVYVKMVAAVSAPGKYGARGNYARQVQVDRVTQFGSPTPVRNCAIDGVVHSGNPAPASTR